MRIYLAAPLFTMAEQEFNRHLCECLEADHEVFLPQRDVPADFSLREIFLGDMEGLCLVDAVVAIVDGADHDSGTAWECGWAVCNDTPVVLVRTDMRSRGDDFARGWGNLMLTQSASAVVEFPMHVRGIPALAAQISDVLAKL